MWGLTLFNWDNYWEAVRGQQTHEPSVSLRIPLKNTLFLIRVNFFLKMMCRERIKVPLKFLHSHLVRNQSSTA